MFKKIFLMLLVSFLSLAYAHQASADTVDIIPTFNWTGSKSGIPSKAKVKEPVKIDVIIDSNTSKPFYVGFYVNDILREEKLFDKTVVLNRLITFEYTPENIGDDVVKIVADNKNEIEEWGLSYSASTGYTEGSLEGNNIIKSTIKITGEPSTVKVIDASAKAGHYIGDSSKQTIAFTIKAKKNYNDGINDSVLNIYYLIDEKYNNGENFKKTTYNKSSTGYMTAVDTQRYGRLFAFIGEDGKTTSFQSDLTNTSYHYIITDKFYDEIAQTDISKILYSGNFTTLAPYSNSKGSDFEIIKDSFNVNYLEGDEYKATREKYYAKVEFKYYSDLSIDLKNGKTVRNIIKNKTTNKTIGSKTFGYGITRTQNQVGIFLTKDEFGNFFKNGVNELEGILDYFNVITETNENNNSLTQKLTLSNVIEIPDSTLNVDGTIKSSDIRVEGVGSNTTIDTATKPTVETTAKPIISGNDSQITQISANSKKLYENNSDQILSELKLLRDTVKEQQNEIKYLKSMANDLKNVSETMKNAINDFVTYGVDSNTVKLGAGERAAVINSYKAAFDKLPQTEAELNDTIKIANGRFPSVTSNKAEQLAKEQFYKIYNRVADMNNANDAAAIKVMAYGLRQKAENRNLNSEKAGIKIFKAIYGNTPKTTEDWNTMQAITYSGATKKIDSDKDGLADETEKKLGTNPNNPDSDGDGYKDGVEVLKGYDPLKK